MSVSEVFSITQCIVKCSTNSGEKPLKLSFMSSSDKINPPHQYFPPSPVYQHHVLRQPRHPHRMYKLFH